MGGVKVAPPIHGNEEPAGNRQKCVGLKAEPRWGAEPRRRLIVGDRIFVEGDKRRCLQVHIVSYFLGGRVVAIVHSVPLARRDIETESHYKLLNKLIQLNNSGKRIVPGLVLEPATLPSADSKNNRSIEAVILYGVAGAEVECEKSSNPRKYVNVRWRKIALANKRLAELIKIAENLLVLVIKIL
tara:strand:+ start:438 stop:992 length:555 start_codon:yes stop_codon:yes gene_type:complete